MPDYKLVFNGNAGQSVSIGGKSLESNKEYIFKQEELPLPYNVLKTIPRLTIEKIPFQAAVVAAAKIAGEKIYRITFNGNSNQTLSLNSRSLQSGAKYYFRYSELPMPLKVLKSMKNLSADEVDSMPEDYVHPNTSIEKKNGLKWDADVPITTPYGKFEPGEIKTDLSEQAISDLSRFPRFVRT
jgi:hypothetical protein